MAGWSGVDVKKSEDRLRRVQEAELAALRERCYAVIVEDYA